MAIIAIANQKGGVGKTTIAFNLAKGLAKRQYKTLAIDNDPQGNLTGAFLDNPTTLKADILNIYEKDNPKLAPHPIDKNLSLIGANIHLSKIADSDFEVIFKLKEGLEPIKEMYDFILIDCLPSFGYLNMAALNAADFVLIPTKPAPFAFMGLKDLFETIDKVQRRLNKGLKVIGIVLNLVEGRKTTMGSELEDVLRASYEDLVFQTRLNKAVKLEESPSFSQSIMEYDPKGRTSQQFKELIDEFLRKYDEKG
jgi:chromosome partitioning protein